jgi:hypothetical protein
MKKKYLFLILIISYTIFFFNKGKDPDLLLECVINLPFDYQEVDSLKMNLEHCFSDDFFSLEVFQKTNELYELYNFTLHEFQPVPSVPVSVEHAFLKKTGVCPKPEFGNNRTQVGTWKKLKSDSIYIIVYYDE